MTTISRAARIAAAVARVAKALDEHPQLEVYAMRGIRCYGGPLVEVDIHAEDGHTHDIAEAFGLTTRRISGRNLAFYDAQPLSGVPNVAVSVFGVVEPDDDRNHYDPDPTDADLAPRWDAIPVDEQHAISGRIKTALAVGDL